jgi:HPt (histidine-containing phosphotransfer) domain-containing protein
MDGYLSKPIQADALYAAIEGTRPPEPPASKSTELGTAPKIFNRDTARKCVRGNDELLAVLIRVFLDECPSWRQELRDAVRQSDTGCVGRVAHKLKGALAQLGAEVAHAKAESLESLGRQAKLDEMAEVWASLEREIEQLVPLLKGIVGR